MVRLPVTRMAPHRRAFTCSKTGFENSGAKFTIRLINSTGRACLGVLSWWKDPYLTQPVVYFSKIKLDEVELRGGGVYHCRGALASTPVQSGFAKKITISHNILCKFVRLLHNP